jgi:Fe-S cluster assembly protein SufD
VLPLTKQTAARATSGMSDDARERVESGVALFEKMPMPDPREEDWRYVDLDVDLEDAGIPDAPGTPMDVDTTIVPVLGEVAGRALSIDGFTVEAEGEGLRKIAGGEAPSLGNAGIRADLDRFAAAHHAFGTDGVVVHIPKGKAVLAPYFVEVQAVTPGALVLPRVVVTAGDGSQGSVVILYRSPDGTPITAVPHVEVDAGTNSHVSVTVIQMWGDETTGISQHHHVGGRDAALELAEAGIGGRFARMYLTMDLDGPGGDARVLSLYFGDHDQTLDYRAYMNHNAPNTTSEMFLKGAVGDRAKSVFTGLIRIEPAAQKTFAHQTNRNLVLSEGAEAHSVPNLEILANDVKCGHASAVGPLDAEQRYYLMSRGLDGAGADRLQVKGFFEEVLNRYRHQTLEPPLRVAVMDKYAGIMDRGSA